MSSEYVAFAGWDWADKEHQISLRAEGTNRIEECAIENKPEALHEWAASMRKRFEGGKVAVCIEGSRGAAVWALMGYEHLVLYPVNPKSAASFREAFHPSGKKDDPVDADTLLEFVEKHHDRLRSLKPADPETRTLALLSETRRACVAQRTRVVQQLGSNLKSYFPQALELAGELDSVLCRDLLTKWPTVEAVQKVSEQALMKFYHAHGSRSAELNNKRLAMLARTMPLTTDTAIVRSGVIKTKAMLTILRGLVEAIAELDRELAVLYQAHPEHDLIDAFPGAGPVMGPRLVSILGSDRGRFSSAEELQLLTGIAPVTTRSGGKDGTISVHRRRKRSKFLHQTIVEWASCAVPQSPWAQAYYQMQIERGKSRFSALRSLGFKLLRILYHCWSKNELWNETIHHQELRRHRSPVVARLVA